MKQPMKTFLYLSLFCGCLALAQKPAKTQKNAAQPAIVNPKPPTITAKDDKIIVVDNGKTYTYDFLLPRTMAVNSYFSKAQKELFYIRYDYTASARSQSYYMVGFRWYKGKIYLRRFANLKNRVGKWSGTTHFYKDRHVGKWEAVQDLLATRDAEDSNDNKNIGIYVERKLKTKMALTGGVKGERFIGNDTQFIALMNMAVVKIGGV